MRRKVIAAVAVAVAVVVVLGGLAYGEASGDTAITKVQVNGGKNVNVGITHVRSFTVSVTATDDSGIQRADFYLYGDRRAFLGPAEPVSCTASSATESRCSATFKVDPRVDLWDNAQAGWWKVAAQVEAYDGDFVLDEAAGAFRLKHYTRLSRNASPEPVDNGDTIRIVGRFKKANWETHSYTGVSGKAVKLQSRPKSGGAYTDVKTVTTTSGGRLYTTVTATTSKCWRLRSTHNNNLMTVTTAGDCVTVR